MTTTGASRAIGAPRTAIRLDQLDALRGLLAVYVLVGHARWLLWAGHSAWMAQPHEGWQVPLVYASATFRYGREAVLIFFALSGFFIHFAAAQRLARQEVPHVAAGAFYRRRAHRLVVPYAFALLVTLVCDMIGRTWFPFLYAAATGDPLLDGTFAHASYSASSVIPALLMLPSSAGLDFGSNGPLWSLAYEVVYYAAYPLWLGLRRWSGLVAYLAVPAALILFSPWVTMPFLGSVLALYPTWLVGAGLAEYLASHRSNRPSPAVAATAFAAALAAYLMVPAAQVKVVMSALFAAAAVYVFATAQVDRDRKDLWLFEQLGMRSFTIYVVHCPFLVLMAAVVLQVNGVRPYAGWLAMAGTVAATAFGCLCFAVSERPFLHRRTASS